MEYGIFSEASVNWSFLKIAGALIALGAVSALVAILSDQSHKRNYARKSSLLGHGIGEYSNAIPIVTGLIAALSFAGGIVLLIFGLLAGHSGDCMDQKYASEGTYPVISATLVYEWDSYNDDRPTKPKKFDLKLKGRTDTSSPSDWKILRCVTVPYDQMIENYKYAPHDLPTFKENEKLGDKEKAYTVHQGEWGGYTAHANIDTPKFIIKKGGNWWKFNDEMR